MVPFLIEGNNTCFTDPVGPFLGKKNELLVSVAQMISVGVAKVVMTVHAAQE